MSTQVPVFRTRRGHTVPPKADEDRLGIIMQICGLDRWDSGLRTEFAALLHRKVSAMDQPKLDRLAAVMGKLDNTIITDNAQDQIALAASLPETYAPVPCVLTQEQIDRKATERTGREIHQHAQQLRRQALHDDDEHSTPAPKILLL